MLSPLKRFMFGRMLMQSALAKRVRKQTLRKPPKQQRARSRSARRKEDEANASNG
jgi:hypothetical protein